jgi:very-short-patch-repair endonuclease
MPTFAQQLRKNPTPAEVRFWWLIHPFRSELHFRKQVRMGPYIVDFASHQARLVIEIDGDTHYVGDGPERDARRDAALAARGYRVLRFTNDDGCTIRKACLMLSFRH